MAEHVKAAASAVDKAKQGWEASRKGLEDLQIASEKSRVHISRLKETFDQLREQIRGGEQSYGNVPQASLELKKKTKDAHLAFEMAQTDSEVAERRVAVAKSTLTLLTLVAKTIEVYHDLEIALCAKSEARLCSQVLPPSMNPLL